MFKTDLFNELNAVHLSLNDYIYMCKLGKFKLSEKAREQLSKLYVFNTSVHTAIKINDSSLIISTDTHHIVLEDVSLYKRIMYSPTMFVSGIKYSDNDDVIFLDEPIYIYIADYYDKEGNKHIAELELYDNLLSVIVDADCLTLVPIREEDLL